MKKNIIRFLALCFVVISFTLLAGCSCNIGSLRVGFEYELNEDRRGYTLKDYHYLDFVEESVKIPKRYKGKLVKAIANGAFSGHKGLTDITIPNSVEYIGNYAFSGCEELEFVEIPNSVVYIGEEAFSDCTNLKEVKLPNNLTTIDKATFSNCSSLKTINIPTSVTRIKEYAFDNCSEITNLSIPDSVVEICLNAFEPNLSGFNRYTTSYGVKYYGTKNNPYMVASCTLDGAEDITIQEGCLYIDSSFTWSNRANVKNVTMASTVKEFGKKTFYYCSNLESIIIPDSLQTIPEETFEHCENLKHITLGTNLNFLPYSALVGCRNIETMTFKNPNGWYFDPHYRANSAKIVELSAEVLADPVLAKDEFYARYPSSDYDSRFDNIRLTKNPDYKFANS